MNKLKEKICNDYKYRIELHAHTSPVSPCAECLPEEVVEAYHRKGYDAIVITNHYGKFRMKDESRKEAVDRYLDDYNRAKAKGDECGINVILGVEYRFDGSNNDFLIYGADREVVEILYDYKDLAIHEFKKEVSLPKSVMVQAHPFRDGNDPCDPSFIDGIETFNMHPWHNARVSFSIRHAYDNNLGIMIPGSDYHHKTEGYEGVAALRTKVLPKDSFELAEILRSGDYVFEIGEHSIVMP